MYDLSFPRDIYGTESYVDLNKLLVHAHTVKMNEGLVDCSSTSQEMPSCSCKVTSDIFHLYNGGFNV